MAFADENLNNYHVHKGMVYRKNKQKHTSVGLVQLINIVGSNEFYDYKYNIKTDQIVNDENRIILPQISYKIEF